jgi:hypothetical protein
LVLMLAVTTVFEGIRAGAGTFRALIDLPARSRIGPVAFAEFSRATDLSTAGIVFYAFYGFGGAILTGATWLLARRTAAAPSIRRLAAFAFINSFLVLLMTTQAAPLMRRVGSSRDAAVLADLLGRFTLWTELRILCVDLSFLCIVAALAACALRSRVSR